MAFKKGGVGYWAGKKRKPLSVETKLKISLRLMGRKLSPEHRLLVMKNLKTSGVNRMKGKKHSQETKDKISKAMKDKGRLWITQEERNLRKRSYFQLTRERLAGKEIKNNCEICGSNKKICFDHDHITGKFRGWICRKCNTALGMVNDDKELLLKLVAYLEKDKEIGGRVPKALVCLF